MSLALARSSLASEMFSWSKLGIYYEANSSWYSSNKDLAEKVGIEISDLITELFQNEIPPQYSDIVLQKKIVIIFEKSAETDAVFFPPKKYLPTRDEWIITINPALLNSPDYLRIISHEFFHAIHYAINPNEKDWIREGLAQLFEYKIHNSINKKNLHSALTKSEYPLETEFNISNYNSEKYGNSFLYFYYLATHCSSIENTLWNLVKSSESGRESINSFLKDISSNKSECKNFSSSAESFSLAKAINSYTGYEQTNKYFLISSSFTMQKEVNLSKALPSFMPERLSLETVKKFYTLIPANIQLWAFEKNFPNRFKKIQVQDLTKLSSDWDIILLCAD